MLFKARKRPYLLIVANLFCNHKCSYCIQQESSLDVRSNPNKIDVDAVLAFLKRNRIDRSVKLMGGEATLHPDFEQLVEGLLKLYRRIVLTTNLNGKWYEDFDGALAKMTAWGSKIRWNSTYHPAWMEADTFIERASAMRDAGVNVGQTASTDTADLVPEVAERFMGAGIGWKLQPFTGRNSEGRLVPQSWDDVRTEYPLEWDVGKYIDHYEEYTENCEDANTESNFDRSEWVSCTTSKFLIGPDNRIYPCHRHLYAEDEKYACGTLDDVAMKDFRHPWDRRTNSWSLPCNTKCNPCDFRNVEIVPLKKKLPAKPGASGVAQ